MTTGPGKEALKRWVIESIDDHSEGILAAGQHLLSIPEVGFKETRTASFVADRLRSLGLTPREGLALTGVKAEARGQAPGPTVAIIGEMDALINYDHPFADPQTGAAHSCGHHAQVTHVLAVAEALLGSGVMSHLAGRVVFFAVPAEEFIEIEYRLHLKRQGKIEFLGGKQELIRLGEFDDINLAMMVHSAPLDGAVRLGIGGSGLAFVAKHVQYVGQSSHAALAPDKGINALNAALLGLMGIHAQRETFVEADHVRVHPIITRGGAVVNAVPDDVAIETYVRAANTDALREANLKVDRALQAGAMAVGARARIETVPGYLPSSYHPALSTLFRDNGSALVGQDGFSGPESTIEGASSDIGDVCQLLPTLMAYSRGWEGYAHSPGYLVKDADAAYILPAKALAMTVIDLLADGAGTASDILAGYTPSMTHRDYLTCMRSLSGESWFPPQD